MGYHVLINYLNRIRKKLATHLIWLREAGGEGTLIPFDVADVQRLRNHWETGGRKSEDYIEVLVNNAGIRKDDS